MRFWRDQSGMEMLEAAITTPIAILVMLAIVNMGMLVYAQQAVQAAARQGARMGSVAQQCPAHDEISGDRFHLVLALVREQRLGQCFSSRWSCRDHSQNPGERYGAQFPRPADRPIPWPA